MFQVYSHSTTRALREFIYTFEKSDPPTPPLLSLSLSLPLPLPLSLSNPLHPNFLIFPRTDNDVDFTVPSLPDHFHFFLPFLSLTSHPFSFCFLCAVQIRCQSISVRGEVKEHRTFLLKLVLFFRFSFTHLVTARKTLFLREVLFSVAFVCC